MSTATLTPSVINNLSDPTKFILTAHERCDTCDSQAYIRATLSSGGQLLFCRHHGNKHYSAIEPLLSEWYSEEVRLVNEKERMLTGSANN